MTHIMSLPKAENFTSPITKLNYGSDIPRTDPMC